MLTPSDLSRHADFSLGKLRVSPSTRRVTCGERMMLLEPRVMQVLVLLSRHPNQTVTRELLFEEVWGGATVGDDSINRAVAGARRAIELDGEQLRLETIPRTGYLLKVEGDQHEAMRPRFSRRAIVAAGAVGVGLAGAGWGLHQSRDERHFRNLIDKGEKALNYGDPANDPSEVLEQAVALRPDDAAARGLLAYALAFEGGNKSRMGAGSLSAADRAAQAALAINPTEPNARLALSFVHQTSMDLIQTEDLLRSILKTAPRNINAINLYWNMLQCVGRSRDGLALVERAMKIEPLAASIHYPLAQLLWITGRTAEADRVIDRAIQIWPTHRYVRFARFTILAFTDRPAAALAMLESRDTAPQDFSSAAIELWRVSLAALDQRTPAKIATALAANLAAAKSDLSLTRQAAMVLSSLGQIDAAFELTNALFAVAGSSSTNSLDPAATRSTAWRFAPWLFVPPMAAVRADPRFAALCDGIGLTDYWRQRRIRPDYQLA